MVHPAASLPTPYAARNDMKGRDNVPEFIIAGNPGSFHFSCSQSLCTIMLQTLFPAFAIFSALFY
jgi:hypothetical protein